MSWNKTEDARWLYNLFSKLAPYWKIYEVQLLGLFSPELGMGRRIESLVLCGLLVQQGCRAFASREGACLYRCGAKYVMVSAHPITCNDVLEEPTSVGLAPTIFEVSGPFITICGSPITLRIRGRAIRVRRVLLEDVKEDGSITLGIRVKISQLRTGAWINLVSASDKITIVFTSPESEDWERANLSGEEVVSSLLRDEKARRVLEDAVSSLAEILKNLPWRLGLAVYLLY